MKRQGLNLQMAPSAMAHAHFVMCSSWSCAQRVFSPSLTGFFSLSSERLKVQALELHCLGPGPGYFLPVCGPWVSSSACLCHSFFISLQYNLLYRVLWWSFFVGRGLYSKWVSIYKSLRKRLPLSKCSMIVSPFYNLSLLVTPDFQSLPSWGRLLWATLIPTCSPCHLLSAP